MKKASLFWIDMEMTGLDPVHDRILEIAVVATDWKLNTIATYEAAIKVDEKVIKERMCGDFWEKNAETKDALIATSAVGQGAKEAEQDLMDFVRNYFKRGRIYIAGNSVHQDRKFLEREMPALNQLFHYRLLDVSAFKIYFQEALGVKLQKAEAHRAIDDILGSIEEFRSYTEMIKK